MYDKENAFLNAVDPPCVINLFGIYYENKVKCVKVRSSILDSRKTKQYDGKYAKICLRSKVVLYGLLTCPNGCDMFIYN